MKRLKIQSRSTWQRRGVSGGCVGIGGWLLNSRSYPSSRALSSEGIRADYSFREWTVFRDAMPSISLFTCIMCEDRLNRFFDHVGHASGYGTESGMFYCERGCGEGALIGLHVETLCYLEEAPSPIAWRNVACRILVKRHYDFIDFPIEVYGEELIHWHGRFHGSSSSEVFHQCGTHLHDQKNSSPVLISWTFRLHSVHPIGGVFMVLSKSSNICAFKVKDDVSVLRIPGTGTRTHLLMPM